MYNEMDSQAVIGRLRDTRDVDVQRKRAGRCYWPVRGTPLNADVQRN